MMRYLQQVFVILYSLLNQQKRQEIYLQDLVNELSFELLVQIAL